jgi:hypothetical protein
VDRPFLSAAFSFRAFQVRLAPPSKALRGADRGSNKAEIESRVPGACGALAHRLLPGPGKAADQECLFSENLRKHIETTRPSASQEDESKRRGLLMLNQLGER